MQRYIRFTMSSGEPVSLEKELAEALLHAEGQLLMVPGEDGNWSGKTVNKAHIVSTDYDLERERVEAEQARLRKPKLVESLSPEQQEARVRAINNLRSNLIARRVIQK